MCLIVVAHDVHPDYKLVIAANRDEFFTRPTQPAHWWDDQPTIFAGRDLEHSGTWFGVSRDGRLAALTNYRDPRALKANAPSRGALPREFLATKITARDYVKKLTHNSADYNAYNLLAWDGEEFLAYMSKSGYSQQVTSATSAISNAEIDTPWPKVQKAKQALASILALPGALQRDAIFDLLRDRTLAHESELPDTGVDLALEHELSAIFIARPGYGTRCSTLVTVARDGEIAFEERSFDAEGHEQHVATTSFVPAL